jgi:hypothetical protein
MCGFIFTTYRAELTDDREFSNRCVSSLISELDTI